MSLSPLEKILDIAKNARKAGGGWLVSCPCEDHGQGNGDRNPSVSVKVANDGRALVKCQAGCETESVLAGWGLTMSDLFEKSENVHTFRRSSTGGAGSSTPSKTRSTDQHPEEAPDPGVTLATYAKYTKLPTEFLKSLGLKEYKHLGRPAVSIPYMGESGAEILLTRSRVSLSGTPKIKTRRGDRHQLYGLWKLAEAREAGYAFLPEGESDSQTLWHYRLPAFGIPGANGWKAEWAFHLEGIERLYFVVEDEAGERCFEKLAATPEIRDRLYRIDLEGVKDVSELHKTDPENFTERLEAARSGARAWLDIAETEHQERSREAWTLCAELAEAPDILSVFAQDLVKSGVSGERKNGKLLYLALTSRVLERIISVAVKGPSSGGKSYLVGKVVEFFPASAVYSFSSFSEKTLYYTEEPLSHRHLILAEAAGGGEVQEYAIRTLLSEGRLEYEFVEKTAEGLRARRIVKEGPTGFITTTTRTSLHAENETRYLSLNVVDTREQTREIYRAIADEDSERPDMARWHALQVWIEGQDNLVTIPYAGELAERIGVVAVRLRRDFSTILSLIRSHAILHQATRTRDPEGRIIAAPGDYAVIRELVSDLIAEGVEATVPKTVRETVEAISRLIEDSDTEHVTNREVAGELDIDKGAASRRVRTAIDRGYVKNLEDRKGHPARLVTGEGMPEDEEILPTVEELFGTIGGVDVLTVFSEGNQHPPPPSKNGGTGQYGGGYAYTPSENGSTRQHPKPGEPERKRFTL